jgi:hypothetical protein
MRPDGIGRFGSLIASTCRSNQSFTAWLVAQTMGPAKTKPPNTNGHCSGMDWPEDTTPQANAHMGGNQVTGLSSSKTADAWGNGIAPFFI